MRDEYEYDKHHRPTFPYEGQWKQFKSLQRVRFWIVAILGLLSVGMLGLLIWQSFTDGVGRDFFIGIVFGTLMSCASFGITRPSVMRWLLRKRGGRTP